MLHYNNMDRNLHVKKHWIHLDEQLNLMFLQSLSIPYHLTHGHMLLTNDVSSILHFHIFKQTTHRATSLNPEGQNCQRCPVLKV